MTVATIVNKDVAAKVKSLTSQQLGYFHGQGYQLEAGGWSG